MAQFTLTWDNSAIAANNNVIAQRAWYRSILDSGFSSTGFGPDNDLPSSANSVLSPIIDSNKIYEFYIDAICTQNGPTMNDNGIRQAIVFDCIAPTVTSTDTTATAIIHTDFMNITKASFTLRKSSDNSIVSGPTVRNSAGNLIGHLIEGLTQNTNYYFQIELFSTVNSLEVVSSALDQLGTPCGPYPVQTGITPTCTPLTSLTVTSVEIP